MAAPIEALTPGLHVLAANVVYALWGQKSNRIHVTGAGVVTVSNDGTTFEAVTLDANFEFTTGAGFIRSVAGATIGLKTVA